MGVHETARRRAFKFKDDKCETCKKEHKRLEVHHKDGNAYNNNVENLMVLCSSCHHTIDGRIKNILDNPNWKENMAKGIKKLHEEGLYERGEDGRFIKWSR